jgi:hypothetical protein
MEKRKVDWWEDNNLFNFDWNISETFIGDFEKWWRLFWMGMVYLIYSGLFDFGDRSIFKKI